MYRISDYFMICWYLKKQTLFFINFNTNMNNIKSFQIIFLAKIFFLYQLKTLQNINIKLVDKKNTSRVRKITAI